MLSRNLLNVSLHTTRHLTRYQQHRLLGMGRKLKACHTLCIVCHQPIFQMEWPYSVLVHQFKPTEITCSNCYVCDETGRLWGWGYSPNGVLYCRKDACQTVSV